MAKRIVLPRGGELAHRRPEGVAALDVHRRPSARRARAAPGRSRARARSARAASRRRRASASAARRSPRCRPARAPRRRRAARGRARRSSRRSSRTDRSRISVAGLQHRADAAGGDRLLRRAGRRAETLPASGSGEPEQHVDRGATCRRRWARAARRSRRARIEMSTPRTACDDAVRRLEGLLEAPELDAGCCAVHVRHAVHDGPRGAEAGRGRRHHLGMTFVTRPAARTRCRSRPRRAGR